jgi:hypothetical protein
LAKQVPIDQAKTPLTHMMRGVLPYKRLAFSRLEVEKGRNDQRNHQKDNQDFGNSRLFQKSSSSCNQKDYNIIERKKEIVVQGLALC